MSDQALSTQVKSAITPWASRDDVRELGERIKTMLPGGAKLAPHEATALAQAAVAHGLDPFNGEIWFIPGRGLMAGIKGHRRAAHRQIEQEGGGNYWSEFVQLTIDEKAGLRIPRDALAFRCRIYDSRNMLTYTGAVEKLLGAGMPWEVVERIMGQRPYTEGIGYWSEGDQTKMTPVQCAQKRAEADALKRRFDLPFTVVVGVNGDADIVDAEFEVSTGEESPAEIEEKARAASAVLYGDNKDLGPQWAEKPVPQASPEPTDKKAAKQRRAWGVSIIKAIVEGRLAQESNNAAAMLNLSDYITPQDPDDILLAWARKYREQRNNKLEPADAAKAADDYLRSQIAANEAEPPF